MRYKYPIGGALVLLIVSFIIHKSRGNKSLDSATKVSELSETATSVGGVISPQNYTQDYGEIKGLLDTLTGELKKSSSSLIQFNADRIKTNDYLNMRNNLFSRDIVVTKFCYGVHRCFALYNAGVDERRDVDQISDRLKADF